MDIAIDDAPAGRLVFDLRSDVKPRTVENFRSLCAGDRGFSYKGCKFHKIVPGFVLQAGDVELKGQKKEGKGGISIYGRSFADENLHKLSHDAYGVLSMANAGPHTNNSQFIITVDPEGTDWCTLLPPPLPFPSRPSCCVFLSPQLTVSIFTFFFDERSGWQAHGFRESSERVL